MPEPIPLREEYLLLLGFVKEDNYDVFPALSPSGEPTNIKLYVLKESKIYTPFKSLEEVEKVVKELNKDQNK